MKNIVIIVGAGCIGADIIHRVSQTYPDSVICHKDNLHEFDEELRPQLLKALEGEYNDGVIKQPIKETFPIISTPRFEMPIFYGDKKGKHNPKSKSRLLWKR